MRRWLCVLLALLMLVPAALSEGGAFSDVAGTYELSSGVGAWFTEMTVDPDGSLVLTDKGKNAAKSIFERHTVLTEFLTKVGVDTETAALDACRIEHVISPETLDAIKKFTEKN
jgi:hypothetical protein